MYVDLKTNLIMLVVVAV